MIRGLNRQVLAVFFGIFSTVAVGCPEHHTVVPRDAALPDAPADLELCRTTSVRCMFPVSSEGCPETIPSAGTSCAENGTECAYCPGGDFGIAGAQTRSCIARRWSSNRATCGSDAP